MEKKDFIIGIDMDDTIEDLCEAWIAWLNNKYECHVNPKDIITWEIPPYFPELTEKEVYAPLYDEEFWKTVKPKTDAMKYLKMLHDEGYTILICTCTHYASLAPKMENLLFKYFPFLDWRDIITIKHKQYLKLDVLIDDYHENLINADYFGILYDTPHNRDFKEDGKSIVRVFNWEGAYNLISKQYETKCQKEQYIKNLLMPRSKKDKK